MKQIYIKNILFATIIIFANNVKAQSIKTPEINYSDTLASRFRMDEIEYNKKRPVRAAVQTTLINVGVHLFDRYILKEDFAKTTFSSIGSNFRHAFVWDNDQFSTNLFAHPYHGNLYYNSARSNGLNFWQSAPYTFAGSMMWEFLGEKEPPALNDMIATSFGGIAIGEVTHRISSLILNDSKRGMNRFWREFAATIINPIQGLNRILSGDAWKIRRTNYLYHDMEKLPIHYGITVGNRYLADDGGLFRGEHSPFVNFVLEYGDPFISENNKPYDYFTMSLGLSLSANQPLINSLHLTGKIWSAPAHKYKDMDMIFGIFQYFNYYDSSPVKDGTSLTPYRISEAAAVGPGVLYNIHDIGSISNIEQRIFASAILLGGTKSDYYNIIDRDYNMGSGYSLKSITRILFPKSWIFNTKIEYYRIYTWKGYENKDLANIDPLYLNAQGDRGNAQLLVINPRFVFKFNKAININMGGAYYVRHTHYKFYEDVKANTFDFNVGLFYGF